MHLVVVWTKIPSLFSIKITKKYMVYMVSITIGVAVSAYSDVPGFVFFKATLAQVQLCVLILGSLIEFSLCHVKEVLDVWFALINTFSQL